MFLSKEARFFPFHRNMLKIDSYFVQWMLGCATQLLCQNAGLIFPIAEVSTCRALSHQPSLESALAVSFRITVLSHSSASNGW